MRASGICWSKPHYHNEPAITLRTIGTAENRRDYFQRALTEYRAAEHLCKLAKNYGYCASIKNNEAVVLLKLGRFKEAHKYLDQTRLITVRFKDRTRTAQIDSTRAELLIAEGKFQAAEAAARRAATALEKVGPRCWLAHSYRSGPLIEDALLFRDDHHPGDIRNTRLDGIRWI